MRGIRYRVRRAYRHVRHLARDPEVQQAGKSLLVLGVMAGGLKALPQLRTTAAKAWMRRTKFGTPGRHALMNMLYAGRKAAQGQFGRTHPMVARTLRAQKRVARLNKEKGKTWTTKAFKAALRSGTMKLD